MNRAAFIVDGQQEQKIIQKLCPEAPVRRSNCNGDRVEIKTAAKKIATLIRVMDNKYYPFIIIFDREDRKRSSNDICKDLMVAIRDENIDDELIIGVPDRNIESWILCDWDNVKRKGNLRDPKKPVVSEGRKGKSIIYRHLPRNGRYQETIEGHCRPK